MIDEFNENLGKYPFVTLDEVKDYLIIKKRSETNSDGSTNEDEVEKNKRLNAIIKYATGAVEHYIGQEVLANTYTEVTIGGETRRLATRSPTNFGAQRVRTIVGSDDLTTGFSNVIPENAAFPESKFVKRVPLKEVYEVRNIGPDGSVTIFNDSTILGAPVQSSGSTLEFEGSTNPPVTTKITKFGKSCLKNQELISTPNDSRFSLDESDFTIEMFIRLDNLEDTKEAKLFSLNSNTDNVSFSLSKDSFTICSHEPEGALTRVSESDYVIESKCKKYPTSAFVDINIKINKTDNTKYDIAKISNTTIENNNRKWAHIAFTRNLEDEEIYIHYNGYLVNRKDPGSITGSYTNTDSIYGSATDGTFLNTMNSCTSITISTQTFNYDVATKTHSAGNKSPLSEGTNNFVEYISTKEHKYNNVSIGETTSISNYNTYIDEVRISDKARYGRKNIVAPTERFRPDNDTIVLLHFDTHEGNKVEDKSKASSEYMFSKDIGQILFINDKIDPESYYKEIRYRAGYEQDEVPEDLKLATLDFIKMIHKQDQDIQRGSLNGDTRAGFALTRNFPAHIKRILDFYRISGTGAG